ncbi:MAG TPA: hypothetical protein VFT62_08730 [Mycobacteriales bacterium]|nr:hypothetical protein [Mycobacteriales bacterium]
MIGYAAHLRVYEPLGSLPDPDRQYWTEYVESGTALSRPVLMALEHDLATGALLGVPARADLRPPRDHAYVRHLDGLTYVCPWRLQVRAWEALGDFHATLPTELAEAFLPATAAADAEAAHEEWLAHHPDVTVGIRSETWAIPIPWFILFEPDERRLVLGERRWSGDRAAGERGETGSASGAPAQTGLDRALVYLTAMSRARRRAARALHVVRRTFEEGPAVDALEEIGRWLEEFHPHSLVELDYGGLVHLLDDEALSGDDSVGDLAAALEHLGTGDSEGAAARYEAVLGRWRAIAALEHAN